MISRLFKQLFFCRFQFANPSECSLCIESGAIYQTSNPTTMMLHVALAHSRLEELLADDALVAGKRRAVKNQSRSLLRNGPASGVTIQR